MTGSSIDKVVDTFRSQLTSEYELDEEFIGSVSDMLRNILTPVITELEQQQEGGAKRRRKRTGVKRKKSAYNVFVREQMKSKSLAKVNHKDKMGKIATMWKELSDRQKQKFIKLADKENAAAAKAQEEATASE